MLTSLYNKINLQINKLGEQSIWLGAQIYMSHTYRSHLDNFTQIELYI